MVAVVKVLYYLLRACEGCDHARKHRVHNLATRCDLGRVRVRVRVGVRGRVRARVRVRSRVKVQLGRGLGLELGLG